MYGRTSVMLVKIYNVMMPHSSKVNVFVFITQQGARLPSKSLNLDSCRSGSLVLYRGFGLCILGDVAAQHHRHYPLKPYVPIVTLQPKNFQLFKTCSPCLI